LLLNAGSAGEIRLNNVPVGPWATGTNLANATGALDPANVTNGSLALFKLAVIADQRLVGNISGANASPVALLPSQVKTMLSIASADINFNGPVTMTGHVLTSTATLFTLLPSTIDNSDSAGAVISGGGGAIASRGSFIGVYGNEHAQVGNVLITTGTAGLIKMNTTSLVVGAGVVVGTPTTGGDKGLGSINAQAYYDDGSPITCVPLQPEFLNYGKVELDKWDKLTPSGEHKAARHFEALLKQGVDPRDPKKFIEAMKRMKALPGMPTLDTWQHNTLSVGEMFSRLWLATEMLAVAWMSQVEKS
jgi:hypothetical protein